MTSETEATLLQRAIEGDESAFDALVRLHHSAIVAVARARVGNPVLAGEIAQDTFVRMFHQLGTFRGDASLRTWLVRVALNLAVDAERRAARNRRLTPLADASAVASNEDNEVRSIARAEAARLRLLVARLPESERSVIALRYDAELSYREIADALAVPIGTVGTRLAQGLRALRRLMETK